MTEQVIIEFIPDFSKLETGLDQVAKTGKVDVKAFKDLQAAIDTTATDTQGLITQFKAVGNASIKMGKSMEDAFEGGINDALKEAGVSMKEFEGALKKANAPAITLKKELQQLKEALARAKAEGKDTGKEFDAMRTKAGKLADAIADANAEIKNAGSDTRGIDNVVGSISALAGGYAAVQGAAALFGDESEDLQKALLKVNSAMALATGIQQISIAVQKEGALAKLADSVATGAQTAAQRVYAFAVGTSTGAMKAFRIALLATGIGAIVFLLFQAASAMGLFGDETDDGKMSTEEFNKALATQNRLLDENITKLDNAAKLAKIRRRESGSIGALGEALEEIKIQKQKLTILEAAELQARKDRVRNNQMDNQEAIANIQKLADAVQAKRDEIRELEVTAVADQAQRERAANQKRLDALADSKKKLKEELDRIAKDEANQAKIADENYIKAVIAKLDKEEEQLRIHFENEQDIIAEAYEEKLRKQKEFTEKSEQISADAADTVLETIQNTADADTAATNLRISNAQRFLSLAQQTAGLLGQIGQIQTERDQQEIASQRLVVEEKLKAGAITEKAAIAARKRIDAAESKARYQAAVREKKAASFQAVLAIPQAFLQGLTSAPPPYGAILGAIAAALAAAQAAIIISKPVPRFFRGKKDSYTGPGIVGDMGTELVERGGRMFLYTKPTETYLGANDKVYNAAETRQIMHNTNISTTVKQAPAVGFDYDRLGRAIPASSISINIDKDFISESVANGLSRTNYMDRRYSSK